MEKKLTGYPLLSPQEVINLLTGYPLLSPQEAINLMIEPLPPKEQEDTPETPSPEEPSKTPHQMLALKEQVGGNHYHKRGIQPITYIQANKLGYEEGNIIKYVTRHSDKDQAGDLKKAIQYITFILEDQYGILVETRYSDI